MAGVSVSVVPTVGAIARRLGVEVHRVEYVIRARGIKPIGLAGNARVFSEAQVSRIASELRRVAEDRDGEGDAAAEVMS